MMQIILMYDAGMRTTFTPAPDIEDQLREIVQRSNSSMNQVVNDLLRKALRGDLVRESQRPPFRVKPMNSKLLIGLDATKFSEILSDLEAEEQ